MPMFPPNHAERYAMAEEVHARPPETVVTPARASYVAVLVDSDERGRERAHLEALCRRFAQPLPAASTTHHRVTVGTVRLKWERHGEFSGYLFIAQGAAAQPFAEPAATLVDADWLGAVPGRTIAATHVDIVTIRRGWRCRGAGRAFRRAWRHWRQHRRARRVGVHRLPHSRRRRLALPGARPRADARPGGAHVAAAGGDRGLPHAGLAGPADRATPGATHARDRTPVGASH